MNLWVILLAIILVPGLAIGAALLWIGTNAMLHGRGVTRDVALAIASLRRVFCSIYGDTARQSLPQDFQDLLATLKGPRPAPARQKVRNIRSAR